MQDTTHRLPPPGGYLLFPTCCSDEHAQRPEAMVVAYERRLRSRIVALARIVRRRNLERVACAWNSTWLEAVIDGCEEESLSDALDVGDTLLLDPSVGAQLEQAEEQSGVHGHVLVVGSHSWWFDAYCKYAGCIYSTPDVGLKPGAAPFVPWTPAGGVAIAA